VLVGEPSRSSTGSGQWTRSKNRRRRCRTHDSSVTNAVARPGTGLVDVWETARPGSKRPMLYTVFIILAIIALLLFIFGRRRV
jgi:hypothetical protein